VFVHGNLSTARFFEQDLAALPDGYRGIAADMRGFGHSEAAPVDAARGVRDFADDLAELLASPEAGGADRVHLVGWSLDGGVAMQYTIDHPDSVASVTLLASMSLVGFGGTRDAEGTLCYEDDGHPTPGHARACRRGRRHRGREVFTDCGHSPHLERPEQFGEPLARFVNANP